ncbi:MAG: hypothetical protein PHT50_07230 [Candidatus Omnitrophica bacterium]|nr:hypothetical protein [Candidatus Omnitrophota bacterium]
MIIKRSIFLLILIFVFFSLSFAEESITITTYYPSPYGSYNELQSNKLAVGDTNSDGQMTFVDLPPANGQIYAARSVIFKPQSSVPSSNVREGEVAYNNADNNLYVYKGSSGGWQAVGGVISYTYYCFNGTVYGTPVCTNAGGNQGYCPAGYTQKLALGAWGACFSGSSGIGDFLLPPGGSCGSGCITKVIGNAYVCSQ